jgi:hypothetical protein
MEARIQALLTCCLALAACGGDGGQSPPDSGSAGNNSGGTGSGSSGTGSGIDSGGASTSSGGSSSGDNTGSSGSSSGDNTGSSGSSSGDNTGSSGSSSGGSVTDASVEASDEGSADGAAPLPVPDGGNPRFVYAAQDDGTIHVYDINNGHAPVKTFRFTSSTSVDVRGAAAAAPTHLFYVMFNDLTGNGGHLVCLDLLTDKILWDKTSYGPRVDRGDVTPDGSKVYLPSSEEEMLPYESVIDAVTGSLITKITMPPMTHDTVCSVDGKKVFMENKSTDDRIRTVDTGTNTVIATTDAFSAIVQPFSVTKSNSFVIANVEGVYGFQYADLTSGKILGTALFTGTTYNGTNWPHGIGITPNESEAWAGDRGTGNHYVHVFDITSLPPKQTHLVTISNDNPHWLTFGIDGRFCYVAGAKGLHNATDVVDTTTYKKTASLGPSEDLLEVDFSNGEVSAVGDQFGVGRQ